ncbi:uncharacterized protein PAC_05875 [Phialocephala subalpina]|uniref:F-box domain protein n=1 Tax=Phialocephala subalpina TaxID=576137 RepID=A0A1L7WT91_9HELO|nr:uncharacterized protein PAC_05875 [Phialocephala subalpina]
MVHTICVEAGEQLSRVKELVYECHTWSRSPSLRIPPTFWNWRQITHLELRGRQMCEYMETLKGLPSALKTLKAENFCFAVPNNEELAEGLASFLSEISGLVHLELVKSTGRCQLPSSLCKAHHWRRYVITVPGVLSLMHLLVICSRSDYAFLSAVARFPSLETPRFYIDIHENRLEYICHAESEMFMVRHLARHLILNKAGRTFEKIEMVFEDQVHSSGGHDEGGPVVLFTARPRTNGDIQVDYASDQINDQSWADYFDVLESSRLRGHAYLEEVLEWNKLGDEADQALEVAEEEEDGDDLASLFGSSSEREDGAGENVHNE